MSFQINKFWNILSFNSAKTNDESSKRIASASVMKRDSEIPEKIKMIIVFRAHVCRWTIKSITSKYGLKSHIIHDILGHYRKQIDKRNELVKKIRRKSKTLSKEYTKIIEDYMNNQNDKRPTVKEIRNHLISKENMDPISTTSIKRILKEKLNYSFKRISTLEHNSARPFNIRKFFESAILQIKLEENNFELIFIDEFSLSLKHNKLYGWSKVGQKEYVLTHYDSFSMFFVVAFSERGIYGIKGASKAMNAAYFISFVNQILEERK